MTILLVSCGWLIVGLVAGALIETHRREPVPDHPGLIVDAVYAQRDADMWHDEYHQARKQADEWKERAEHNARVARAWAACAARHKQRADSHEAVLAALGRSIAEGGTLEDAPDA